MRTLVVDRLLLAGPFARRIITTPASRCLPKLLKLRRALPITIPVAPTMSSAAPPASKPAGNLAVAHADKVVRNKGYKIHYSRINYSPDHC